MIGVARELRTEKTEKTGTVSHAGLDLRAAGFERPALAARDGKTAGTGNFRHAPSRRLAVDAVRLQRLDGQEELQGQAPSVTPARV
jgi:hypothetical protein